MVEAVPEEGKMLRRVSILFRRNRWLQAGALTGLWWCCQWLAQALALPVPGGVVGMVVLLGLLLSGRLPASWIHRGTTGFLDHMVLFFVPAFMALMNHHELLGLVGLKMLGVILGSTLVVMVGTALVVELCMRGRRDHAL
jgi:holin-like protein